MDSKKLNIGFFLGSNLEAGGGFQYESKLVEIIYNHKSIKYNFKFFCFNKNIIDDYRNNEVEIHYIQENIISKIFRKLLRNPIFFKILNRFNFGYSKIEETLIKKYHTDLAYFLSPSDYAIDLNKIPFIITGLNCNSVFAVLFSFSKGLFLTLTTSAMTVVVGCKD